MSSHPTGGLHTIGIASDISVTDNFNERVTRVLISIEQNNADDSRILRDFISKYIGDYTELGRRMCVVSIVITIKTKHLLS